MNYFRLRDIATPPFAYVVNREEVIDSCDLCLMPFPRLKVPLKVEIFTTDLDHWEHQILGQPIMAESWLIGDEEFKETLETLLPGSFNSSPVEITSFLRKTPIAMRKKQRNKDSDFPVPSRFFSFHPIEKIHLDRGLKAQYPPIECPTCHRSIPDIPFDVTVIPDIPSSRPQAGFLVELLFEGYDYLLHESAVQLLAEKYPKMIFEELSPEPFLF